MAMHPEAPKNKADLADSIQKWIGQFRLLEVHGDDYKARPTFKTTALTLIMHVKRELENMEEAVSESEDVEANFTQLLERFGSMRTAGDLKQPSRRRVIPWT